jgi:hypothetical protein
MSIQNLLFFGAGLTLGAFATGFTIGYILRKNFDVRKKLPYRWTCNRDRCRVELSNSHWDGLMRMADRHNEQIHGIQGVME